MTETQPIWCVIPWLNQATMTLQAVEDCLAQTIPTRVLLINQGASTPDREQIDNYIDQRPDHRVLCWHFVPPLPSLSAVWNRALAFVWELGGEVALVVNNDVRLKSVTCALLRHLREKTDALFISAVGVTAAQFDAAKDGTISSNLWPPEDHERLYATMKGGPDFSCFLLSKEGHAKYPFDESLRPCYCEDLDMHRRYMLGGDGDRIFSVNLPFLHYASGTIKAYTPEERAKFNKGYAQVVARYTALWGGPPNEERFVRKGDPTSAADGVTTPELQRRVQAGEPAVPVDYGYTVEINPDFVASLPSTVRTAPKENPDAPESY